ncbi:MAG: hypothetical protein AMS14_11860 [Planctomycetes bacterium DG_20]|nr:MAG: hypothetical protein AMS14_11860 [Planctomycetes bacterium DG_20]
MDRPHLVRPAIGKRLGHVRRRQGRRRHRQRLVADRGEGRHGPRRLGGPGRLPGERVGHAQHLFDGLDARNRHLRPAERVRHRPDEAAVDVDRAAAHAGDDAALFQARAAAPADDQVALRPELLQDRQHLDLELDDGGGLQGGPADAGHARLDLGHRHVPLQVEWGGIAPAGRGGHGRSPVEGGHGQHQAQDNGNRPRPHTPKSLI